MQASAGVLAKGESRVPTAPMNNDAISVAVNICMPAEASFIRINRSEWPDAAIAAQYKYTLRGGLLIAAKPIAAIAAYNASNSISSFIDRYNV